MDPEKTNKCYLRDELNIVLKRKEIIQLTGTTNKTFITWNTHRKIPNLPALLVLAELYNTNISYLLSLAENNMKLESYEIDPAKMRFADIRAEWKISQLDLAELTGLQPKTIRGYEKGILTSNFNAVFALADAYNVCVEYLLGLTNIKHLDSVLITPNTVLQIVKDNEKINCLVGQDNLIRTPAGEIIDRKELDSLCFRILAK